MGSLYDEDLLRQYPEEIEGTTTKYDRYGFEFRNYWLSLINNTYDRNMAGVKKSIVQIEGFPLVTSRDELYVKNENWYQSEFDEHSFFNEESFKKKGQR